MLTVDNGFAKFICRIENKEQPFVKVPWPKLCHPSKFVEFIFEVVQDYTVGDYFDDETRWKLEDAFIWDTSHIEGHCIDLYNRHKISEEVYKVFEGWYKRLEKGEAPSRENYV